VERRKNRKRLRLWLKRQERSKDQPTVEKAYLRQRPGGGPPTGESDLPGKIVGPRGGKREGGFGGGVSRSNGAKKREEHSKADLPLKTTGKGGSEIAQFDDIYGEGLVVNLENGGRRNEGARISKNLKKKERL